MAITVSKDLLFSSGEIAFSSLRNAFKQSGTTIKASELLRDTLVTREQRNPIVPDATENLAISSESDWKTSQFRNSIKYYDVTQSSSNTNMIVQDQSWNGNLNRSIVKSFSITGTITSSSGDALTLSADAYNLQINISGGLYGRGGNGGGSGGGNGTSGTDAFSISSNGRVIVNILSSANVYGGGGGGGGGSNGATGPTGSCFYYDYYRTEYQCGTVPSCGGNLLVATESGGGCNCTKKGCKNTLYRVRCRKSVYYQVPGGSGGSGGGGGDGRGSNYSGGLGGSGGSAGQSPFCSDPNLEFAAGGIGSFGGTGQTGGSGGDWGTRGDSAGGSGGAAGRAIRGSFYTVIGSTGPNNIKGGY
jgi:hypothetical protein